MVELWEIGYIEVGTCQFDLNGMRAAVISAVGADPRVPMREECVFKSEVVAIDCKGGVSIIELIATQ